MGGEDRSERASHCICIWQIRKRVCIERPRRFTIGRWTRSDALLGERTRNVGDYRIDLRVDRRGEECQFAARGNSEHCDTLRIDVGAIFDCGKGATESFDRNFSERLRKARQAEVRNRSGDVSLLSKRRSKRSYRITAFGTAEREHRRVLPGTCRDAQRADKARGRGARGGRERRGLERGDKGEKRTRHHDVMLLLPATSSPSAIVIASSWQSSGR